MKSLFFSPRGGTKQTARAIWGPQPPAEELDLLGKPLSETLTVPADEAVMVTLPVYAGRIPAICKTMLQQHLRGQGGPAIAVVVYGNRAYDNALAELQGVLTGCGFCVLAAGAFVARHSIFPAVAEGRPDAEDRAVMAAFGQACREKLSAFSSGAHTAVAIPGNPAIDTPVPKVPYFPDCNQNCIRCMACVNSCPVHAIPQEEPTVTDHDLCISCAHCIFLCPTQARQFRGEGYQASAQGFAAKNPDRKEPETFFA